MILIHVGRVLSVYACRLKFVDFFRGGDHTIFVIMIISVITSENLVTPNASYCFAFFLDYIIGSNKQKKSVRKYIF